MAIDLLQPKSFANKDVKIFVSSSSVTEIIASAPETPASLRIAVSKASPYKIVFCTILFL